MEWIIWASKESEEIFRQNEDIEAKDIRITWEKCYELQKALELYNKDKSYSFTVSFGISYSDGNPINLDELYQIADHNLYKNKSERNRNKSVGLYSSKISGVKEAEIFGYRNQCKTRSNCKWQTV